MTAYQVRTGPFLAPVTWRIEDELLLENREGRAERRWPLTQVRRVQIAGGENRLIPDQKIVSIQFRRGKVLIPSHVYQGLGRYEARHAVFTPFVQALCARIAVAAPSARFELGSAKISGAVTAVIGLLALGVVMVLMAGVGIGAGGLGLDLAARLSFPLILIFAVQPWLPGMRARTFDPQAVSGELFS